MELVLMYVASVLAIAAVVFMLLKKLDIKITLLGVGMALIVIAMAMGKLPTKEFNDFMAPFNAIIDQFKATLPKAGLIILILGGYTAYMSKIGANDVTVNTLTKPLRGIRSAYVLVPIVFLLGNVLSLVIPSASNLAIILLATLYPVLRKSGMSTLTAAAVIATTATVMPTPLGGDNVAIAQALGMDVSTYVFRYHAIVSVPTLFFMAFVHYFWQMYLDKKDLKNGIVRQEDLEIEALKTINGGFVYKTVYTLLPLLPIVILLLVYVFNLLTKGTDIGMSVELVSLISFVIAIVCELIRKRNSKAVLEDTESFFRGMGNAMGIVALLVAAGVFVQGLKSIGIITHLQDVMTTANVPGFTLPLILVLLSAVIVILSGSGTALFYAMVPLMAPLALAAGISAYAVTVPMGLAGNLLRAVSPVSAVVVIVSGTTKQTPFNIVKRTAVPMVAGVVFMFVLSMLFFL
ncbi:Anaerobic C4-dicarboxylate transporter [Paracholeplasma brassicae]|uniref:Anaerobic C4-dicarboxylate transporter n=1 Tax=Acholeplasma brassicae TaxID=61635 RepID=U4KQW5_9MOLU|nr:C4-dicarboxylate transporter DcuC [Paracholeplasma brassicae]CCV65213.1 Anaerobic C4-dicarboxylate transporter [Paracholeplasma brassicae]